MNEISQELLKMYMDDDCFGQDFEVYGQAIHEHILKLKADKTDVEIVLMGTIQDRELRVHELETKLKDMASSLLKMRQENRDMIKQLEDNERRYSLLMAGTDGICKGK